MKMKGTDFKWIVENESPYLDNKDVQKFCKVKYASAYNYICEFKKFCQEKHIYPMDCYFEFFGKQQVDKFAFCHYVQYRDLIVKYGEFEPYDEEKYKKKLMKFIYK